MTAAIAFSLAKQTVFCSMDSVRRHCGERYRKHKFDNHLNVHRGDIRLPIRASWPKGDKRSVMSTLSTSRVACGNPSQKAAEHVGHIGREIPGIPAPEAIGRLLEGPRC